MSCIIYGLCYDIVKIHVYISYKILTSGNHNFKFNSKKENKYILKCFWVLLFEQNFISDNSCEVCRKSRETNVILYISNMDNWNSVTSFVKGYVAGGSIYSGVEWVLSNIYGGSMSNNEDILIIRMK